MKTIAQDCLIVMGIFAFGATVGLAYYGSFTDDVHAWTACFVSAVLCVICGFAAWALEEV